MGLFVKNTTDFNILDLICPFTCRGCGRLGGLLCERCKNDIKVSRKNIKKDGIIVFGERRGLLMDLIKEYKYGPVRGLSTVLAGLIAEDMPKMVGDVVIVPLPTVAKHVRERGFDHMTLIARKVAKMNGYRFMKCLKRMNSSVQVGADAKLREKQASSAYKATISPSGDVTYILIDDVLTTGASMRAAMREMKKAGAKKVFGAVLAANE